MQQATINTLFANLTATEVEALRQDVRKFRGMIYCRGKAKAEAFTARGFDMVKESAQIYCVSLEQARALRDLATEHGEAVKVLEIIGKFCDSMGAFEAVLLEDSNGQRWEVGNMYDTKACFREMSEAEILAYVNNK